MESPEQTEQPALTPGPFPRRRDSAATREAVLLAAREVFTRLGYDRAGIREIAAGAGIDARLIGRYFGSKEKLFAEVVDIVFEKTLMMGPGQNQAAAQALGRTRRRARLRGTSARLTGPAIHHLT